MHIFCTEVRFSRQFPGENKEKSVYLFFLNPKVGLCDLSVNSLYIFRRKRERGSAPIFHLLQKRSGGGGGGARLVRILQDRRTGLQATDPLATKRTKRLRCETSQHARRCTVACL